MVRILLAVFLVGGVAALERAGAHERMADAEKELRELEAAEAEAILASDLPALEKLWSEDYTVNAPDNQIRDRKGVVAAIKAGVIKYTSFDRKVERVGLHGDTAVVMGSETVKPSGGPEDGKTVERRYTDVWGKKDGKWLMIARHAHVVSVK